jgi:hypothetical protein
LIPVQHNKNGVMASLFSIPGWIGPDSFTIHPTNPTEITWSVVAGYSGVMYIYLAFEGRTILNIIW